MKDRSRAVAGVIAGICLSRDHGAAALINAGFPQEPLQPIVVPCDDQG